MGNGLQRYLVISSICGIFMRHHEIHTSQRLGWLRASVLGANDGIISTASLMMGMVAAGTSASSVLLTGVAGLVAGAMSMAAGEYVSVHSQADTEKADIRREIRELEEDLDAEHRELEEIYVARGLTRNLAKEVARQMMAHDALAAHARDELGITEHSSARPLEAALASAASFALGATIPLLVVMFAPIQWMQGVLLGVSLVALACLGGLAARVGRASVLQGALRVCFWGAAAMGLTALVGHFFSVSA
ncbi:nodulin 21-like protein [Cellvibrio japonicus Ueda107]|uniref:Nodulin 21-like protein n=2 Tax=Cellvibrio japonicus TaxID=155077 RepID=B3PLE2_CELJU|nr:nodulin 21-like protein [Cellvibrio japonicus Ueda107]